MKKLLVTSILIGGSILLSAQEQEWSLDDCVIYALEHNISLKRQELATELTRKDLTQSKLNALPNLNGQVQHNLGSGRILDEGTYEWVNTDIRQGNLGLASNVTLFSGLQGFNAIKMSEAAYLASKETLEYSENTLMIGVVEGYLNLLRRKELLEIAMEKADVTDLQVARMEMLLEVGDISRGELLEVKAQSSAEHYNATLAENEAKVADLYLRQLMNLPLEKEFTISIQEISAPNLLQIPELIEVYEAAASQLPQVKSAEHTIKYYNKNLAVARGALVPEIYARAYYNSNYNNLLPNPRDPGSEYPVPDQIGDNRYSQFSVGITVPIFNKWQARTNISKAKIGVEDANYHLSDIKQQLLAEIQNYHTDALAAYDNYESASESFANSDEAYTYTEEKFKVGLATPLELEEARNRLFESRSGMVTAKYVFVFYAKILEFYMGNPVTFDNL